MTFLGQHTVSETNDLVRAKDITIQALVTARANLGRNPDPTWDSQFADLKSRYDHAKILFSAEKGAMALSLVSDDYKTSETAYNAILDSLAKNPVSNSGHTTETGDLQDLWNRLQGAKGGPISIDINSIQPRAVDTDLEVYKAADKAVKKIESPNTKWMIGGTIVGIGLAAVLLRKL